MRVEDKKCAYNSATGKPSTECTDVGGYKSMQTKAKKPKCTGHRELQMRTSKKA